MNLFSRSFHIYGLAVLMALAAALFLFTPARAEGEPPPPETPAAPVEETAINPAEAPPQVGGDAHSPAEEAGGTGFEPLAISSAGMDLQINAGPRQVFFKVGGTTYQFLQSGQVCPVVPGFVCNVSAEDDPIEDALNFMNSSSLLPSDRFLYILAGTGSYNANDELDLNGSANPIWAQLKGYIGEVNDLNEPLVTIADAFQIQNMPGGFLLKGLRMFGSESVPACNAFVCFSGNGGTIKLEDVEVDGTSAGVDFGLVITNHNGGVDFNRVSISDNPENGARIETTARSGSIKITASAFNDNGGAAGAKQFNGLQIVSNQVMTLNAVSVNRNTGTGLNIFRRLDGNELLSRNITIKNSTFDDNVSAHASFGFGIRLGSVSGPVFLYPVGNLLLENVGAGGNDETGLYLFNQGNITLKTITTDSNVDGGVQVDTCDLDVTVCDALGTGSLTVTNLIHAGFGFALSAQTKNAITLTNVHSEGGSISLYNYYNTGNVTLTDISVTESPAHGLLINTNGKVTLKDVQAFQNGSEGISIASFGNGDVILKGGSGIQNIASENGGVGFYISTGGKITIANLDASGNGVAFNGYGALLDNSSSLKKATVAVSNSAFNDNDGDGLSIISSGAVSVKDVHAIGNVFAQSFDGFFGNGVAIDNDGIVAPVSLSNVIANENDGSGISVITQGAVSAKQMETSGNSLYGTTIFAANVPIPQKVTINNLVANDNSYTGLNLFAEGAINLQNLTAMRNEIGIYADNTNPDFTHPITLSASSGKKNLIADNDYGGLSLDSSGAIKVSNTDVLRNSGEYGAFLDNSYDNLPQTITVSNSKFNENLDTSSDVTVGLRLQSLGSISLKGVSVIDNEGHGVFSDNDDTLSHVGGFSASQSNFDQNGGDGLQVQSRGKITLSGLIANGNGGEGLDIDNRSSTTAAGFSASNLTGNSNGGGGIELRTNGLFTGSNLTATLNGGSGLEIESEGSRKLSLTTVLTSANNGFGISIVSYGNTVNISKATSFSNSSGGVYAQADSFTVSILNSTITGNQGYGVLVDNNLSPLIFTGTISAGNKFSNLEWN